MKPRTLTLTLLAALFLPACDDGSGDDEGANVDCGTADVKKFSEITTWSKCTACHSTTITGAARMPGTEGINFDDYASAMTHAQKAMDEVAEGAMPPGGGLSDAEKDQIINWASCDTPQ